jgi:hypothetical protein
MLNLIWLGLLLFGVLVAGITGQFAAINQGALNAAKSDVMDVAWLARHESAERTEHQAGGRYECNVHLPGDQY